MYTKEELEAMEIPQLMGIAKDLGITVSQDSALEDVIYDIIDKAAENSAASEPADGSSKRKRTRIAKKDTNKVYTVKGKDGENLDSKSNRTKSKVEAPSLFSDAPLPPVEEEQAPEVKEEAAPKRRGRKPKAAEPVEAPVVEEVPEQIQNLEEAVPEAAGLSDSGEDDIDTVNAVQMLREKMANRKEEGFQGEEITDEDVWEGDPGDGTDFITIVDIPIEDNEAIPTLDMFDRPMAQQAEADQNYGKEQNMPKYDFSDFITGNGVLECLTDGYGFLRSSDYNYLSSPDDVYVSPQQIKKYGLKTGDVVECTVRPPHENEKYFAMSTVKSINGREPSEVRDRVAFEHLTPLFPEEKFTLCGDKATISSLLSVKVSVPSSWPSLRLVRPC